MTQNDPAIVEDLQIMGGAPVFKGTRVLIDIVLASADAGVNFEELREAYPFLTEEIVDAARSYGSLQPDGCRPAGVASSRERVLVSREYVPVPKRYQK